MNDGFEFRNHGLPDVQRVRLLRPGLAELLELCGVRVSALTQRREVAKG
jgi:hypothetical protein